MSYTNIISMLFFKCIDEDREKCVFSEMRRLVRGARRDFLTHLGAVFPNKVGKNGHPPLSERVAFFSAI